MNGIAIAGPALGIVTQAQGVLGVDDDEGAFAAMTKERADAVIVQPSLPRRPAIELALKLRLPALSPSLPFTGEGTRHQHSSSLAVARRRGVSLSMGLQALLLALRRQRGH